MTDAPDNPKPPSMTDPEPQESTVAPSAPSPAGPRVVLPDEPAMPAEEQEQEPEEQLPFQPLKSIAGSLGLGMIGAGIWAAITLATDYELGLIALILGILAGKGATFGGRGIKAQAIGAVCAAICYFAAQLIIVYYLLSKAPAMQSATNVPAGGEMFAIVIKLIATNTFTSISALFFAFAVWEGFSIPRAQK